MGWVECTYLHLTKEHGKKESGGEGEWKVERNIYPFATMITSLSGLVLDLFSSFLFVQLENK
jgi:hypothetical protein